MAATASGRKSCLRRAERASGSITPRRTRSAIQSCGPRTTSGTSSASVAAISSWYSVSIRPVRNRSFTPWTARNSSANWRSAPARRSSAQISTSGRSSDSRPCWSRIQRTPAESVNAISTR
jgi:hypothetical protein